MTVRRHARASSRDMSKSRGVLCAIIVDSRTLRELIRIRIISVGLLQGRQPVRHGILDFVKVECWEDP